MAETFSKIYLKGEFSYGFWNSFTRVIGAINTFLVISYLTLHEYGSFQLLLVSYAGVATFLNIGGGVIRNDILRFEAEGRSADAKKLFYESSIVRIIIGLLLWTFAFFNFSFLSFRFDASYVSLIRVISFLFLHDAIITSVTTLIEMRKKFNIIASRASIAKIVQLPVLLYFILFSNLDLQAVVISLVISMFVTLGFLLPSFFEAYKPWRNVKNSPKNFLFKILSSYGKWELFQPMVSKLTSFLEPWAIKLFINTEAVAIFSVAQTLIGTVAGFFPVKTLSTLVPFEINDEGKLRKIYTSGVKYLVSLSVAIGVGCLIFVPPFITLFFNKYTVSLPFFKVLLITLPFLAISGVSSVFLIALRRQKFLFFQKILKIIIAVALYLLLLPMFGLWGIVIQNIILTLIMTASIYIYLKNTQPKLFINWQDIFIYNEEDKIFLKKIVATLKGYIGNKFLSH
jgi:O-antigen/teichoic acid export membrane protein